jgi:hypothetical protein
MQAPVTTGDVAGKAIQGLTAWDQIAHLVTAFGGGMPAVFAIGILGGCVVIIVGMVGFVGYFCYRSHNRTKIALAKINARGK